MRVAFQQEVDRINPFRVEPIPFMLRVYKRPSDKWTSIRRRTLFGAPFQLLFFGYQKLWPFSGKAFTWLQVRGQETRLAFNPKNTQFSALYMSEFSQGYESQTTSLICHLLPESGVFWDVGSNWGWFSICAATRPNFRGQVHAFEPFGPSYSDLQDLVKQAHLQDAIVCHNVALSDSCGRGSMRLPDHMHSGLASLEAGEEGEIELKTIDAMQLPPPSLIKIDVEGAEDKVFAGGINLITTHKPMIVFEHGRTAEPGFKCLETLERLHSWGYHFYLPFWIRTHAGKSYLVPDNYDWEPSPREKMALVEFDASERLTLPEGVNIFACHTDRISDLGKRFQPVT